MFLHGPKGWVKPTPGITRLLDWIVELVLLNWLLWLGIALLASLAFLAFIAYALATHAKF